MRLKDREDIDLNGESDWTTLRNWYGDLGQVFHCLYQFIRDNNLGTIYDAPLDVVLGNDIIQPDIIKAIEIAKSHRSEIRDKVRLGKEKYGLPHSFL